MKQFRRIYLDTNIFIMLGENSDAAGDALRRITVAHSEDRDPLFVTSELTLSELLVRPYREENENLSRFYRRVMAGEVWLRTSPVSPGVLETAAVLRAVRRSIKLPDAIHAATAMAMSCSHLLTNDTGLKDFEVIPHPFVDVSLPSLSVIRPDTTTLSAILEELAP